MATVNLGSVHGKLELDISQWKKGAEEAKNSLAGMGIVAGQTTGSVTSSFDKMGKNLQRVGAAMTLAITTPLVLFAKQSLDTAIEFDKTMRTIAAVGGIGQERLEDLEGAAKQLGRSGIFTAQEISEAMVDMVRDGLDPATEGFEKQLNAVHNLAAAAGVEMYDAQVAVSNAMFNFGATADDAAKFTDVFANVLNKTQLELYDVGDAMTYIGPVASQAGLSFEEVAAAIGIMGQAGIKGSMAGTTLRRALLNLQTGVGGAGEELKKLGLEIFNSEGEMRDFPDILKDLESSFSDMTDEQKITSAEALFGAQAVSGMLAIIGEGPEAFDEMTSSMAESGTAQKIMEDRMQGLAYETSRAKSAMFEIKEEIGNQFLPVIKTVADILERLRDAFAGMSPQGRKFAVALGGIAAAIGPVLGVLGTIARLFAPTGLLGQGFLVLKGLVAPLATAFTALATALGIGVAPLLIIIGIIAGLIAIGVLLYKNWDTVKAKAGEIWNSVSTTISTAFEKVAEFFKTLPEKIGAFLSSIPKVIGDAFWNGILGIVYWIGFGYEYLRVQVPAMIEMVRTFFAELPGKIWAIMTDLYNRFVTWGKNTWDYLVQNVPVWISNVVKWFTELPGKISQGLSDLSSSIKTRFLEAWDALVAELKTWPSKIYDWGKNIAQGFIDGFKNALSGIADAFKRGVEDARKSMEGKSPPIEGPLRNIDKWGFNVGNAWVDGMRQALTGFALPQSALSSSSVSPARDVGANNTINNSPTFNVNIGVYAGTEMEKRNVAKEIVDAYNQFLSLEGQQLAIQQT